MNADCVWRFLFDDLDIVGAFVSLGPVWGKLLENRDYPAAVARLLGEMSVTCLLLGGNLKQPGRLTIQLRGNGPVSLLIIDCDENLQIRGMARCPSQVVDGSVQKLFGDGQLLLSLDMPSMREPYQSIVPLDGDSIATVFEHYLMQSVQSPARFFLAASGKAIAGLMLQKLPAADQHDTDGWARVEALAATVKQSELLALPAAELLGQLFPQETVRLFPPTTVVHNCPEDWHKVRALLRSLGPGEVYAILREHGAVVIQDDICNREYRFDAPAIDELFRDTSATPPRTLH
ncbi:MAG: Hsp33 family molecular chaperone HslO [Candidatus Accumulibacter sp.]|uniref:Hsp33 family molecular chaperone HslO n=1 Tax=Accumulibacter sp. TaxID=2053492 RepID=UPI001A48C7FD|nr:Hsp33 family molecular chaperone HslO [Accumulibacter sp.]MBL8395890.1 Hsp33 family molecular chaperone HslO [Accumulibacter sp.]